MNTIIHRFIAILSFLFVFGTGLSSAQELVRPEHVYPNDPGLMLGGGVVVLSPEQIAKIKADNLDKDVNLNIWQFKRAYNLYLREAIESRDYDIVHHKKADVVRERKDDELAGPTLGHKENDFRYFVTRESHIRALKRILTPEQFEKHISLYPDVYKPLVMEYDKIPAEN